MTKYDKLKREFYIAARSVAGARHSAKFAHNKVNVGWKELEERKLKELDSLYLKLLKEE